MPASAVGVRRVARYNCLVLDEIVRRDPNVGELVEHLGGPRQEKSQQTAPNATNSEPKTAWALGTHWTSTPLTSSSGDFRPSLRSCTFKGRGLPASICLLNV